MKKSIWLILNLSSWFLKQLTELTWTAECGRLFQRFRTLTEKKWSLASHHSCRNRLERGAGFSPQYSVLCLRCRIFDVWHVELLWVRSSSYLPLCIKRVRAITNLDNARRALSRLVIALSQPLKRAFTDKGCTLHRLKGAWHCAVNCNEVRW